MCEPSSEKSELEEEFWSSHLVMPGLDPVSQHDEVVNDLKEDINKAIKKSIMKLFAVSAIIIFIIFFREYANDLL